MTIATMADRSLPLADSVHDVIVAAMKAHRWTPSDEDAFWATADELLADIAAADRLARATDEAHRAFRAYQDAGWDTDADTASYNDMMDRLGAYAEAMDDEANAALAAYRARMAQGVGRG